jgi:hypothetical protein
LHAGEIDMCIEGDDQPFLRPGYRANTLYNRSLDQGPREIRAELHSVQDRCYRTDPGLASHDRCSLLPWVEVPTHYPNLLDANSAVP